MFAMLGSIGVAAYGTPQVLAEDNPLLPYTLAGTAYIGLAILLPLMAIKMARAIEHGNLEL